MSYLRFLAQWYNWPYLAVIVLAGVSFIWPALLQKSGSDFARLLGFRHVAGQSVVRVFAVTLGAAGLTVNGALHDYWPVAQERAFLPGFVLSMFLALLVTRAVGRVQERHFPEIKAVGFGARHLAGSEGRVVSQSVGPNYLAGRAQVMSEDGRLHMVLCKTSQIEIPYGTRIILGEYDNKDGRYYAKRLGDTSEDVRLGSGQDRAAEEVS